MSAELRARRELGSRRRITRGVILSNAVIVRNAVILSEAKDRTPRAAVETSRRIQRSFVASLPTSLSLLRACLRMTWVSLLCSCSWFTDFKQQPKIDPWETAADTIPFRGNPQMSVPTYGSVAPGFIYDRLAAPPSVVAMAGIANPVPADSASVNRGRVQFQINCAPCHGPAGQGNGTVVKYGFPGLPIGVGSNAATTLSDGYIFGMIRNGRGLMPSYNRIEEPDRWDVVNYLRSIQGKGTIAADTSHGRPGETGSLVPGASRMGPTRPAPYYHISPSGADTTRKPAIPTDTTKKPEHQP